MQGFFCDSIQLDTPPVIIWARRLIRAEASLVWRDSCRGDPSLMELNLHRELEQFHADPPSGSCGDQFQFTKAVQFEGLDQPLVDSVPFESVAHSFEHSPQSSFSQYFIERPE